MSVCVHGCLSYVSLCCTVIDSGHVQGVPCLLLNNYWRKEPTTTPATLYRIDGRLQIIDRWMVILKCESRKKKLIYIPAPSSICPSAFSSFAHFSALSRWRNVSNMMYCWWHYQKMNIWNRKEAAGESKKWKTVIKRRWADEWQRF